MLIDTHAHLDMITTEPSQIIDLVSECREKSLTHIIQISTNIETFLTFQQFIFQNPACNSFFSHALGFGPDKCTKKAMPSKKITKIIEKKQICAIGEVGLDYYHNYGTKKEQQQLFESQLQLAEQYGLPVIIHNRESDEDLYAIVQNFPGLRGVVHCFSSDAAFGKKMVALGFYISFAGNLTYKNAHALHEAAATLPMEKILLETDSPFLSPTPFRGKANLPWRVRYTADFLAKLRGISFEEVCRQTSENGCALFAIT